MGHPGLQAKSLEKEQVREQARAAYIATLNTGVSPLRITMKP
jgi:hypothetical protein